METNWAPLEKRLGSLRCVGFMFMGRVNGINRYKHGITRTYLNLDDDGNCYVAGERGNYTLTDCEQQLAALENDLSNFGATLSTPYDDAFIEQKHKALQKQGISLLTISVEPRDSSID